MAPKAAAGAPKAKAPKAAPAHPKYAVMVAEAISELKERTGSSRQVNECCADAKLVTQLLSALFLLHSLFMFDGNLPC